jgi:integrase
MYYCVDAQTGKRTSLQTANEDEARQLVDTKNLAARQPAMNLQIAQVYLQHGDPALAGRTWQQVMEQMLIGKLPSNLARWQWAIRDHAFDQLRHRKLIETNADHFLAVLKAGTVATNVYLRRIHNYAVNMHWLPWPILPKPSWPKVRHHEKRAITLAEHQSIIARELNPATRAFYELLWHLGGAQTDIATLTAGDIDWKDRTIAYRRHKTGTMSLISFGKDVAAILQKLPREGELFPALARIHERHRAKMFIKRLKTVGVSGVSLHSYRYAWAERAKEAGYPERFAMQALGHSSKAVHRAYAKKAQVVLPPLEEYENRARKKTPVIPELKLDACRN